MIRLRFPSRLRAPSWFPRFSKAHLAMLIGAGFLGGGLVPWLLSSRSSPVHSLEICRVIDGDTINCRAGRVRIVGLDTPEINARCAEEHRLATAARERLRALIAQGVTLNTQGHDRYQRMLAVVRDARGRDVAGILIGEGLARPYHGGRRSGWC